MNNKVNVIVDKKNVDVKVEKTIIKPKTQTKEVIPSKEIQEILPDGDYLLSQVTVQAVPEEYIIPEGEIEIIENGEYNVTDYETANVNIKEDDPPVLDYNSTSGSTTNLSGVAGRAIKKVKLVCTQGGVRDLFKAFTSLTDVEIWFENKLTNVTNMFSDCTRLENIILHDFDTSDITSFNYMFNSCSNLKNPPLFDTGNATSLQSMFYYSGIQNAPLYDTKNVTSFAGCFEGCNSLDYIPAYDTRSATSFSRMFSGFNQPFLNNSESLNNILQMCINATSYTGAKNLTALGLPNNLQSKIETLPNYEAFTQAGWTAR